MNRGLEISADAADAPARSSSTRSRPASRCGWPCSTSCSAAAAPAVGQRAATGDARDEGVTRARHRGASGRSAGEPPTCWSTPAYRRGRHRRRRGRRDGHRRRRPGGCCPASSTCTPTCASRAARTPRPSPTGTRPRPPSAASPRSSRWPTPPRSPTPPGVVEQVWRLGPAAGLVDVQPVGAVTSAWRASSSPSWARWPTRARRVRVFSDDGHCVDDARAHAPGAGVRQGFRRRRRPARAGAAARRRRAC